MNKIFIANRPRPTNHIRITILTGKAAKDWKREHSADKQYTFGKAEDILKAYEVPYEQPIKEI